MRVLILILFLVAAGALHALGGETCIDATVIDSLPYWDSTTTEGFVNNYSLDPSGCTGNTTDGPDAVYRYTSNQSTCLALNVVVPLTFWNPALYVLTDCDSLICIGGADMYGPGSPEALYIVIEPGVTYYFVVDGRTSSDYGLYKISISECQSSVEEMEFSGTEIDFKVVPSVSKGPVSISLSLPSDQMITVAIYNSIGRRVTTLYRGRIINGKFVWDGKDQYGRSVKSGVYFARLDLEKRAINVPFLISK
jgi:hypothetical protein